MTFMTNLAQSHLTGSLPAVASFLKAGARESADRLRITTAQGTHLIALESAEPEGLRLRLPEVSATETVVVLSSAIEMATASSCEASVIQIENVSSSEFPLGALKGGQLTLDLATFWQWPFPWIAKPAYPCPQIHVLSNGQYHPKRPVKPVGVVYERFIPWLNQTLTFRAADPEGDIDHFHRWMNDDEVNLIWEDGGSREKHLEILSERRADPHMLALIGSFDGVPFGYFEVYWAKENRLGPYYDAHDYDRGWHVAIGEPAYRGKKWITAWLPSLMHFIFLDDPRTQRIVGEPRASHHQQIRNLDRSGFAKVKHFDFPHKRALLVMLTRERFFGDHLWTPAA